VIPSGKASFRDVELGPAEGASFNIASSSLTDMLTEVRLVGRKEAMLVMSECTEIFGGSMNQQLEVDPT
jgi:hypothetical protein